MTLMLNEFNATHRIKVQCYRQMKFNGYDPINFLINIVFND